MSGKTRAKLLFHLIKLYADHWLCFLIKFSRKKFTKTQSFKKMLQFELF